MPQPCRISQLSPVLLAVAQAEMPRSQIPVRIRGLYDAVYAWKRETQAGQTGHNYAVYEKGYRADLLVRAGFPVSERFTDTPAICCYELPGGRVAHRTHVGPYSELHRSYVALEAWCRQEALALSGQSWEVYGDWYDDPSKLETEICFRLRDV